MSDVCTWAKRSELKYFWLVRPAVFVHGGDEEKVGGGPAESKYFWWFNLAVSQDNWDESQTLIDFRIKRGLGLPMKKQ